MNYPESQGKISVRALTEGALMTALAVLFGIIGIYIPALEAFTRLLWTIPFIMLIMRHNFQIGLMGVVVTGVLITFIAGPVKGILLLVNMGGIALLYGYCFKNHVSPMKTVLIGTVVSALSSVATITLSLYLTNLDIGLLVSAFSNAIDELIKLYRETGVLDKLLVNGMTPEQFKEGIMNLVKAILPGVIIAGSMIITLLNYLLARTILKRLKYEIPDMPMFRDWHFPWYIVWGVIFGLGLLVIGNHFQYPVLRIIGQNILYIYYPILLVSGISFVVFLWKNHYLTGLMRVVVILSIFMFSNVFFMALLCVGLFDPLFDYRRFFREKKGN